MTADTMRFEVGRELSDDEVMIRTEVFMEEQGFVNEFDDIDSSSVHIVLYVNGEPAGVCRLIPGEEAFTIGRVAVRKAYRGRSLGTEIMREAERQAFSMGAEAVELSAQVRAKHFYESCGYAAYGDEYPDEGVPHVMMRKPLVRGRYRVLCTYGGKSQLTFRCCISQVRSSR